MCLLTHLRKILYALDKYYNDKMAGQVNFIERNVDKWIDPGKSVCLVLFTDAFNLQFIMSTLHSV